jgi:hypothetical protein
MSGDMRPRRANDPPRQRKAAAEPVPFGRASGFVRLDEFVQNLGALAMFVLISREALGGAFRYYFSLAHVNALWFLPDALILLAFTSQFILLSLGRRQGAIRALVIVLTALFGILVATRHQVPLLASISQLKLLMPLLLLIALPGAAPRLLENYRYGLAALLLATLAFVAANHFIQYPWVGFKVEQFGASHEAARLWWTEGQVRLAGATSASFTAGAMILLLLICTAHVWPSLILRGLLLGTSFYCMHLTTCKTGIVALLILTIIYLVDLGCVALQPRFSTLGLMRTTGVFLFLLAGLVPLLIGTVLTPGFSTDFSSLQDRVYRTWPGAISMLKTHFGPEGFLVGGGLGAFGSATVYTNWHNSPITDTDNFLVYLVTTFGLASVVFYLWVAGQFLRGNGFSVLCLFAFAAMAATSNCEEPPSMITLAVGLGVVLSLCDAPNRTQQTIAP